MDCSDQQLITNYFAGDDEALEVLIKRYLKPIFGFTYRYVGNYQEAEDITQEVFIKVWRNLKKFDRNRSFKTWIFAIAKNTAFDHLKKKKAIPFSNFENEKGENSLINKLADFIIPPKEPLLGMAVEKLPSKYRTTLSLHYNDQFTFREIAETIGESINTVKSRHRRGISLLKKLLA
ncbi:MAG: sigma-70 family RNA polymerase sigma factor [Candidatus Nealsonbacteria bacterium]